MPSPPPLRTGRAPFRRIRLKHETTHLAARGEPPWSGGPPARYANRAGSRNASVVAAAPARTVTVPPTVLLCCLTPDGCPLTCVHTRGKSAPFRAGSCRLVAQPLSNPLQVGFCFLPPPLPAALSGYLTTPLAVRRQQANGLPRSASGTLAWCRSRLFAGGTPSASEEFGASEPDHVPFGPSLTAS